VPWEEHLRQPDVGFLTDNQISLWLAQESLGIDKVWFYPVPRAPHLDTDQYDIARIGHESIHEMLGPCAEVARDGQTVSLGPPSVDWLPSRAVRTFEGDGVKLVETTAAVDDMVIVWLQPGEDTSGLSLKWTASVGRTQTASWRSHGQAHVCLHDDGVANGWVWMGSDVRSWDTQSGPGCLSFESELGPDGALLVLAIGYDQAAVERRLESMISRIDGKSIAGVADELFAKAHQAWEWYFSRMVPPLAGAPEWLQRLYYYQTASHRINLYDIPYEPFMRPYTCPWKTGAIWQWSWNTPMNAVAERWLNDPAWAESGIELMHENGGALNMGASLHRLRKPRQYRDVNDFLPALWDAMHGDLPLPATARQFDWAFIMPHTTPLGVHAMWSVFQRNGDDVFLERHLQDMVDYEAMLNAHDHDADGLVEYHGMVDEYDFSVRWRTVIDDHENRAESLIKFNRPLELIDINAQLCLLRENIAQAADTLGNERLARRMRRRWQSTADAINNLMWDDERGCYQDIETESHEGTGIFSVAAYSAMMAGVASEEQAERMVAHLDDPNAFGSPYPVPSVMMDTPGLDPSKVTYGGDVLLTSGVWTTVLGLVRYGYLDHARRIVWQVLEMVGKNGPTSAYSYNSVTGEPNMYKHTFCSQSAILLDLFVRYVIGFVPRQDDIIECWPFALPTEWEHVEFGPMTWRGDIDVTIVWDKSTGYTIKAGPGTYTIKEPRRIWLGLDTEDKLIELPDPAVYGEPVMA